jgi:integrase
MAITKKMQVDKNIYQRGECSFQVKMMVGGHKLDKTFDTLSEAKTYRDLERGKAALDHTEGQIYEARARKREVRSYTLSDAIKDYRKKKTAFKKGYESEGNRLDLLERLPLVVKPIFMIGKDDCLAMLEDIRSGQYQKIKGVEPRMLSDATLKRYYNLIHHIFEVAKTEWRKVDRNPLDELAVAERPKDGKPRDRRLKGNEYERLLKQLTGNARVALIVFVEAAPRKSELLSFDWQHIAFKGKLGTAHLPKTKNGEERNVPLSSVAVAALKTLMPSKTKPKEGKVFKIGEDALR